MGRLEYLRFVNLPRTVKIAFSRCCDLNIAYCKYENSETIQMNKSMKSTLVVLGLSVLLVACGDQKHGGHADHGGGDESDSSVVLIKDLPENMGAARGKVTGFTNELVMIDHGKIQGTSMGAMNMGFSYMKDVDISSLKEGDEIAFLLKIGRDDSLRIVGFCKPSDDGDDCLQSKL